MGHAWQVLNVVSVLSWELKSRLGMPLSFQELAKSSYMKAIVGLQRWFVSFSCAQIFNPIIASSVSSLLLLYTD